MNLSKHNDLALAPARTSRATCRKKTRADTRLGAPRAGAFYLAFALPTLH